MTTTSGMVPANPTRRFKNWKTVLPNSAIRERRRNFLESQRRGRRDLGGGLGPPIGLSDSQPQRPPSCLWLRLGFSGGVRSPAQIPNQDGTLRVSRARQKWNRVPSEETPEPPSLASAKRWSPTAIPRPTFPSPILER